MKLKNIRTTVFIDGAHEVTNSFYYPEIKADDKLQYYYISELRTACLRAIEAHLTVRELDEVVAGIIYEASKNDQFPSSPRLTETDSIEVDVVTAAYTLLCMDSGLIEPNTTNVYVHCFSATQAVLANAIVNSSSRRIRIADYIDEAKEEYLLSCARVAGQLH
ncbi:hypothetical protein VCHA53O466_50190 [Vibrio chagasii]|nr:hypothetical protein VCHA53O466_50190 [Vibrio chagasii]